MEDKIDEKKPLFTVSERDAKFLLNEITDICTIAQTSSYLPETTEIKRSPAFYIEEIVRALKEYNIITD
jgi:hypothetical protein